MYAHKKPIYGKGRILTAEILECMRDATWDFAELQCMNLTDGIVVPCAIAVLEDRLVFGKGMLRWKGRTYLMMESEEILYAPTEEWRAVKVRFLPEKNSSDFSLYETELFLDDTLSLCEDEIELCRFKLKAGHVLRQDYTGFADLNTEFDTLNMIHAVYAGEQKPTIAPYITRFFGKEVYPISVNFPFDNAFAALCLNSRTAVNRELIEQYVCMRRGMAPHGLTNEAIYAHLNEILDDIRAGVGMDGMRQRVSNKRILVD